MYCEHCGTPLSQESIQTGRCLECGELKRTSERGPWPGLFLVTLAALIVVVVILVSQPRGAGEVPAAGKEPTAALPAQYELSASFGDLGPRLIEAGAIDPQQFVATYDRAGQPLDEAQLAILKEGSDEPIAIDRSNAYFLLNFLWALGLTNDNPILTEGPMMTASEGNPGRFASVGGWTIGQKPAAVLYASAALVPLSGEQQQRVEEVAENVYRPCCNNHTAFADCNHGMALLGLLQLMASQDATVEELYESAKYVSAFWYPQQAAETAIFFKKNMNLAYADVDPRMAVGRETFSAAGFEQVHEWLVANNTLPQPSGSGNSCGV